MKKTIMETLEEMNKVALETKLEKIILVVEDEKDELTRQIIHYFEETLTDIIYDNPLKKVSVKDVTICDEELRDIVMQRELEDAVYIPVNSRIMIDNKFECTFISNISLSNNMNINQGSVSFYNGLDLIDSDDFSLEFSKYILDSVQKIKIHS